MIPYLKLMLPEDDSMFCYGDPLPRVWERNNPKPRDEAEMSLPVNADYKVYEHGSEALLFQLLI